MSDNFEELLEHYKIAYKEDPKSDECKLMAKKLMKLAKEALRE